MTEDYEIRAKALDLALEFVNVSMTTVGDDDVVTIAEKFRAFLAGDERLSND